MDNKQTTNKTEIEFSAVEQKAWKFIKENNSSQDKLCRLAITDGSRSYTYKQMFEQWDRYASVFSAMNMSRAGGARVGIEGVTSPENIFAIYALNMVGAEVSVLPSLTTLDADKLINDIENEHLTDLIFSDMFVSEQTIARLFREKEALGLRNIIILHVTIGGSAVPMPVFMYFENKAANLRRSCQMLYMDYLMMYFNGAPVSYDTGENVDTSFILHTSGTTSGSGKPIVLSDLSMNSIIISMMGIEQCRQLVNDVVSVVIVDLNNLYSMAIQVHSLLAAGGSLVTVPGNTMNPFTYKAIPAHKVTVMFCHIGMLDMWMKNPMKHEMDLSSVKLVIFGGAFISAADKKRFKKFFMEHGMGDVPLLNGYGISEAGGVCAISTENLDDETIGYGLPGFDFRFYDEDAKEYLTMEDKPLKGVLYLNSRSMTPGILDGREIVHMEMIDGKPFICTNDFIGVDENGKFTFLGRANRYFLDNKGIKYQSGLVETLVSAKPDIDNCGITPVYHKITHDNLPMLCVKTVDGCENQIEAVRKALIAIFIEEKSLEQHNLPRFVLLAEELPRNANGKIDFYKINKGEVSGQKYSVIPVCENDQDEMIDLQLKLMTEEDENYMKDIYKILAKGLMEDVIEKPKNACKMKKPHMENDQTQMQQALMKWQLSMCMTMQQHSMFTMNYMNQMMQHTAHRFEQAHDLTKTLKSMMEIFDIYK